MRKLLLLMTVIFTYPSWAAVTVGNCPEAFEGKVKAIAEGIGSNDGFGIRKVIFINHQTIRGVLAKQPVVDMLANGPFEVEAGKDYRVQLRKGKLCWIEAI